MKTIRSHRELFCWLFYLLIDVLMQFVLRYVCLWNAPVIPSWPPISVTVRPAGITSAVQCWPASSLRIWELVFFKLRLIRIGAVSLSDHVSLLLICYSNTGTACCCYVSYIGDCLLLAFMMMAGQSRGSLRDFVWPSLKMLSAAHGLSKQHHCFSLIRKGENTVLFGHANAMVLQHSPANVGIQQTPN